jgi:hypothetical protein
MALTFNGSSSSLTRAGTLVSRYPFTLFAWTRATVAQSGFAVELAVDPGPRGTHEGHGMLRSGTSMRAWSSIDSSVSAYSSSSVQLGVWLPCMVVFASDSVRRVYYSTGVVQSQTTALNQDPALLNVFSVGKQAVKSANYWAGDLACVGLWSSELTASDYAVLAGGAVPSTVQTASLVDYWSLLTQSASHTGVKGFSLAAANTAQAANHPIAESGADTTPPTFAGTLSTVNLTSVGYTLTWPAASDNLGVTAYEVSLNGGPYASVGNVLSATISGRSPGTTDQILVRARDAAGNASAPLSINVTLPPLSDTTPPVLTGTLTVSALTSTSYTLSWTAATDNVGVTSYEVSLNGGAYTSLGGVLSIAISGRSAGSTDQVLIRAKDAAGNASAPLSINVTLPPLSDTMPPVLTGTITVSALASTSYTLSWPSATDNVGVASYEFSVNGGIDYTPTGLSQSANVTGRTPGATDQVRVRAKDAAGNASSALSASVILLSASDTSPPVLTGAITVSGLTTVGYTLSWGAATDNLGVSSYERSLDGGASWLDVGNVLTVVITGRTPGSVDQVRLRAKDAAGNVSTPALAATVTLATGGAAALVTPPMKNNTGTLLANLSGITVNVYNVNTGALVVRKTGLSSNAAGMVTISDATLVSGNSYAYEVVTPSSGRRLPTGTAA